MSVGLCKNCSCARSGIPCVDCYPSRDGRCCNQPTPRSVSSSLSSSRTSSKSESSIIQDGSESADPLPNDVTGPSLPPYSVVSVAPSLTDFTEMVDSAYTKIVHWRSNIFKLPTGALAKKVLAELTRLFQAFNEKSLLENIAVKAAMILPALVLQKPHPNRKRRIVDVFWNAA